MIFDSSFTVQNSRMQLVKIDHVCFGYLATTSHLSGRVSTLKDFFILKEIFAIAKKKRKYKIRGNMKEI